MAYNIIVLVKQVPDTQNITGEAMKEDGTVNRIALPAIFNPEDLNALEEALKIKERYGGKITVITMGPPSAAEVLRRSDDERPDDVVVDIDGERRLDFEFAGNTQRHERHVGHDQRYGFQH